MESNNRLFDRVSLSPELWSVIQEGLEYGLSMRETRYVDYIVADLWQFRRQEGTSQQILLGCCKGLSRGH
jgi:hypothetical protein